FKAPSGPTGPNLPRRRIADARFRGHVETWGKSFGWIRPDQNVQHPKARQHGGKIYIHYKDVRDASDLQAGSLVEFYIFEDEAGLGAEECVLTSAGHGSKGSANGQFGGSKGSANGQFGACKGGKGGKGPLQGGGFSGLSGNGCQGGYGFSREGGHMANMGNGNSKGMSNGFSREGGHSPAMMGNKGTMKGGGGATNGTNWGGCGNFGGNSGQQLPLAPSFQDWSSYSGMGMGAAGGNMMNHGPSYGKGGHQQFRW
ncbi:unnamed protein product, partial [Polarella glacialis]